MALIKCSFCIYSLLLATAAGADLKFLAKETVPNGAQPFSIGVSVNPLSQVISMIQKITDDVRKEATDEFKIFDNFACFCKDKTKRLTKMVKHHAGEIDISSSNIALWTSETNDLNSEHTKRSSNHEKFSTQFDNYKQYLKEENANWNSIEATFKSNMQLIKQALSALKDSKKTANAFLQVPRVAEIKNLLEIADAMGLVLTPKHKAIAASLLQGGAHTNPLESYGYHGGSDDVIELVQSIQGQMRDTQKSQGEIHERATKSYQGTVQSLRIKIRVNKRAISQIERSVSTNVKETAEARTILIENNQDLKDTEDVLQQITTACENRATEYDMRFAARQQELEALNTAMACLSNAHGHAVRVAGGGALLQDSPLSKAIYWAKPRPTNIAKATASQLPESKQNHTDIANVATEAKPAKKAVAVPTKADAGVKSATKSLSFLQTQRSDLSSDERKMKALDVIRFEGKKVQSLMLMSLAENSDKDPFAKVKQLITDLRFRLEAEAQGEVNKEVWCKQNLEVARHERNAHFENAKEIGAQIERIDAHIETLKQSIKYHTDKAIEIGRSLVLIYTDISQLSEMQLRAMNIQTEARDEIQNAINILRAYYSGAAKAASNPYTLVQADGPGDKKLENFRKERMNIHDENERRSDEDGVRNEDRAKRQKQRIGDLEGGDPSAVRSGSLGDAIALMETIVSDFNREIGNLKGDLDAEHKELVRTNAVLEGQKKSAEEMAELDTQELKSAKVDKGLKLDDMKTQTNLMDLALKELANLSPTCIDTGMSYSQRVEKRETEMAALVKALCILDENNVEVECK